MAQKLTDTAVRNFQPRSSRREIPDGQCQGLHLVVQPSGVKSWAFRFRVAGKSRKLTLDKYPALSLADAREQADRARSALREKRDPAAEKRLSKRAEKQSEVGARDIIENVAAEFVTRETKDKGLKQSTVDQLERIFRNDVLPRWRGRRVQEITKRDVIELRDAVVDRGAPVLANRVFAIVRWMFNWCIERDILDRSPCVGMKSPREASRDRVLSDEEVVHLWGACESDAFPFGRFVQVLILTGQRREEVSAARWEEFDLEGRTWAIPASRTKNSVAHEVPLSDPVLALLRELPSVGRQKGFVFTLDGKVSISGFSRAKARLDAHMEEATRRLGQKGAIQRWTLHDLRRTLATGLQKLGVRLEVTEAILNHTSGSRSGIVGVYQRHEWAPEKRAAMDAWAAAVGRLVAGASLIEEPASNVRPIRKRA